MAAILFKIDFQWKRGLTAFSKTSRDCQWDNYGETKRITPMKVKDMAFTKPQYQKGGNIFNVS